MINWRRKGIDMADEFKMLDIVTAAVESAGTGIPIYQEAAIAGERNEHIVVANLSMNDLDAVNKAYVNVNVFTRRYVDGPDTNRKPGIIRPIRSALRSIRPPFGMYWKSRIVWSEPLGEAKEGFDCTNIRLEVITEKD